MVDLSIAFCRKLPEGTLLKQAMVTTGYQGPPPQEAASSAASAAQAGWVFSKSGIGFIIVLRSNLLMSC
jgi:hypothetical protein